MIATILWIYIAGCVIVYAGLHTRQGREFANEMSEQVGNGFFSPEFVAALASLLSWYIVYVVVLDVIKQNYQFWSARRKIRRMKGLSDENKKLLIDQLRRGQQED